MQSQELENVALDSLVSSPFSQNDQNRKKNKFDFFVTIIRWVDFMFIERVNKEP